MSSEPDRVSAISSDIGYDLGVYNSDFNDTHEDPDFLLSDNSYDIIECENIEAIEDSVIERETSFFE